MTYHSDLLKFALTQYTVDLLRKLVIFTLLRATFLQAYLIWLNYLIFSAYLGIIAQKKTALTPALLGVGFWFNKTAVGYIWLKS